MTIYLSLKIVDVKVMAFVFVLTKTTHVEYHNVGQLQATAAVDVLQTQSY